MTTYYIYILSNPNNDEVFYVGSTTNPRARETSHWSSVSHNSARDKYVKEHGIKPAFTVIDQIDVASKTDVRHLEGYWIWQFRSWGFHICNKQLIVDRKDFRGYTNRRNKAA